MSTTDTNDGREYEPDHNPNFFEFEISNLQDAWRGVDVIDPDHNIDDDKRAELAHTIYCAASFGAVASGVVAGLVFHITMSLSPSNLFEHPGVTINKFADPVEGAREGISLEEAAEIFAEDPGLIWIS